MYGDPMNLEPLILLTHNYIIGLLENFFKVIICDESVNARIHLRNTQEARIGVFSQPLQGIN